MMIPRICHQTPAGRAMQESDRDPESVKAVVECSLLGVGAGTHEERAANYVKGRAKLLEALRPGSAERLLFVATFPASYEEACAARPKDIPPLTTHVRASHAIN
jgi:hypothetical protein